MPLTLLAQAIRRGLAAGLLGGLLAGVFALVVAHEPMEAAIRLEAADGAMADGHDHDDPLFTRATQRAMLPVATTLVGLAVGGLFGLTHGALRHRLHRRDDWANSLTLGACGWAAVVVAPALTFPPNPPGVGDGSVMSARTGGYVASVAAGLGIAVALWLLARRLRTTPLHPSVRHTLVLVAGALLTAALLAVLPSDHPADGFPAELLWRFRLASLGTQTVLWVGIAVGSGLLWSRDETARTAPSPGVRTRGRRDQRAASRTARTSWPMSSMSRLLPSTTPAVHKKPWIMPS
jgi:predicted cobalt transporter CbtA